MYYIFACGVLAVVSVARMLCGLVVQMCFPLEHLKHAQNVDSVKIGKSAGGVRSLHTTTTHTRNILHTTYMIINYKRAEHALVKTYYAYPSHDTRHHIMCILLLAALRWAINRQHTIAPRVNICVV